MQTSGLVLDLYDDFTGETVRALWPELSAVPAHVKQASALSAEDRERLPDDVFALVLVNNGERLRKYACVDAGNTELSVLYFLKNAHKLPVEAQKTAAANLQVACGWYDLQPPAALEKIALGLGTAMTALTAVPIARGTHQAIRDNMAATHALEGAGMGVVTPEARAQVLKQAEVNGTILGTDQMQTNPVKPKATVLKIAKATPPDVVHPPTAEQPGKLPQAKHMTPTVDVSTQSPPKRITEKKAASFALPSLQRYPLDSYAQVKEAGAYFDTYYKHMEPAQRREYAIHFVKRASELRLPASDVARKYGSEDFAPEAEIKAAFDCRRLELCDRPEALDLLKQVEFTAVHRFYKEASLGDAWQPCSPDGVVALLAEFDQHTGLDHMYDRSIPDPFYSIFGFEKSAASDGSDWSDVVASEMVTRADLDRLVRIGAFSVKATFGADFQEKFLKDPVGTYTALPLAQKKMVIRMANSTQPGAEVTY